MAGMYAYPKPRLVLVGNVRDVGYFAKVEDSVSWNEYITFEAFCIKVSHLF